MATATDTASDAKPAKKTPAEQTVLVLDTTAVDGPRTHEQIVKGAVKPFTFKPGEPLDLPVPIAVKFLRHPAFRPVNAKGETIAYERPPRQPEDLGAGERLVLADSETVARYDELGTKALLQRALEMPNGEQFATTDKPDRGELVKFILETKAAQRKANASKEPDVGKDAFVPDAELEDEAA